MNSSDAAAPAEVTRRDRAVVARVVAAFAAVLLALAATEAVVIGLLRPQLAQLTGIGDDHARAVGAAARLRRQLADARARLLAPAAGAAARAGAGAAFARIEDDARELEPLVDTDEERAELAALRRSLSQGAAIARRASEGPKPEPSRASQELEEFGAAAAAAGASLDALVLYNARQVRQAAHAVRRRLLLAMVASTVLAGAAFGAALLLLAYAVRGVRSHAAVLEQRSQDMAAFASRAAHELRSPLQNVAISLELVARGSGSAEALERARRGVRKLAETIEHLLEFSKSGAPRPGDRCDVAEVLDEVATELAERLVERGARLERRGDVRASVAMASSHLRTVLLNLLGNALRYGCPHPGAVIDVRAAVRPPGERVLLTVHDSGDGIPRDALAHVFEPLYRASATPGGYGLGLATVKRLVDAHGGEVTISSEPDRGTTVTVELPGWCGVDERLASSCDRR